LPEVTGQDLNEMRVALCSEDRQRVSDHPERQASDPKSQAETQRRRNSAIDDRDCPWSTG
jgi:hypothetical protein